MNGKVWEQFEIEILQSKFADCSTTELAKQLGRSYSSISSQACIMGLRKSEEYKSKLVSKAFIEKGKAYRFQPGNIPPQKGKKMPQAVYEKCKDTMFKKGVVPHNTKFDGYESLRDGYVYIRVRPGKHVLKHRLIWEKANGPIPKGHALVFKDGNQRNITLENLELVTRAQLMQRNTIHQYPEELQSTIRLLNKLKRKVYEK